MPRQGPEGPGGQAWREGREREDRALLEGWAAGVEERTCRALGEALGSGPWSGRLKGLYEVWRVLEIWRVRLDCDRHGGLGRAPVETELAQRIGRRWRRLAGDAVADGWGQVAWAGAQVRVGGEWIGRSRHLGGRREPWEGAPLGAVTSGEARGAAWVGEGRAQAQWRGAGGALARALVGRVAGELRPWGAGHLLRVPAEGRAGHPGQKRQSAPGAARWGGSRTWEVDGSGRIGPGAGVAEPRGGWKLASLAAAVAGRAQEQEAVWIALLCQLEPAEVLAALRREAEALQEALGRALSGPLLDTVQAMGVALWDVDVRAWRAMGEGVEGGARRRERMLRMPLWGRQVLEGVWWRENLERLGRADANAPGRRLVAGPEGAGWGEVEEALDGLRAKLVEDREGALGDRAMAGLLCEMLSAGMDPRTARVLEAQVETGGVGRAARVLWGEGVSHWLGAPQLSLDPRRWRSLLHRDPGALGRAETLCRVLHEMVRGPDAGRVERGRAGGWRRRRVGWVDAVWADPAGVGTQGRPGERLAAQATLGDTWTEVCRRLMEWVQAGGAQERTVGSMLEEVVLARPAAAVLPLVRRMDRAVHSGRWRSAVSGPGGAGGAGQDAPPGWAEAAQALAQSHASTARVLSTPEALAEEGHRMGHCIGGWDRYRAARVLECVHLEGPWGEATAVYAWRLSGTRPEAVLEECRAAGNQEPAAAGRRAAQALAGLLGDAMARVGDPREAARWREGRRRERAQAEAAAGSGASTREEAVRIWEEGIGDRVLKERLAVLDPGRYAGAGGAARAVAAWTGEGHGGGHGRD